MSSLLNISDCPKLEIQRKVDYDFQWFRELKQIIIDCKISYYKDGLVIPTIKSRKQLVASDSLVNPQTGQLLSEEQVNLIKTREERITKYDADLINYFTALANYQNALTAYQAALADWNLNGSLTAGTISRNLNGDSTTLLTDYNDWANLSFPFVRNASGQFGATNLSRSSRSEKPRLDAMTNDLQPYVKEDPPSIIILEEIRRAR